MNIHNFTAGRLQEFIAFLTEFEAEGVTDVRFVRQRVWDHLKNNSWRYKMTPEQREKARERKRIMRRPKIKKAFKKSEAGVGQCPECLNGTLFEVRREGIVYIACRRNGRYGCGYSEIIGDM